MQMQTNHICLKTGTNSLQQEKVCGICPHYHSDLSFSHVNHWEGNSWLGSQGEMHGKQNHLLRTEKQLFW